MRKKFDNPSRTSPKSNDRGCLCKDTLTYSKKCCDGTLWAQGIGRITGETTKFLIPYYWGVSNTPITASEINTLVNEGQANVINEYPNGVIDIVWFAQGQYLWFAYESQYQNKTSWFVSHVNQGSIGGEDDLFGGPTQFELITDRYQETFKFYVSNYATTTSGSMELRE
jgi:hypothetical protein